MHRQMKLDGNLLREHRMALGSREYVVALSNERGRQSFSISSLIRAERGRVSKEILCRIALVLEKPIELYLFVESRRDSNSAPFLFSGEWLGLYLEDDIEPQPYIVSESISLTRVGESLKGIIMPHDSDHPSGFLRDTNFVCEAHAAGNLLYGHYSSDSSFGPSGLGCFELVVTRNGEWLDGFCMFYDDVRKISVSPYIWIKRSAKTFTMHVDQAKTVLTANRPRYTVFNNLDGS